MNRGCGYIEQGVMRFYNENECRQWLHSRNRLRPNELSTAFAHTIAYPESEYGIYGVAHWIAHSLPHRLPSLLWITEWGIWPSCENLHLYYTVRRSYGDLDLLEEKAGHLFLGFEAEDLASFLQIAMLNGWGGYLLTDANYVNIFFSHDEYLKFLAEVDDNLDEARKEFPASNVPQ